MQSGDRERVGDVGQGTGTVAKVDDVVVFSKLHSADYEHT